MNKSKYQFRLSSVLWAIFFTAICFATWSFLSFRYRASDAGIISKLQSDIAESLRLEVFYDSWFFSISNRESLSTLGNDALWADVTRLREYPELGVGYTPSERIGVQIVSTGGQLRYFELIDSRLNFDRKYALQKSREFRNELVAILASEREIGAAVKIRDVEHGASLFTN